MGIDALPEDLGLRPDRRPHGAMGHVNMVGSSRLLPGDALEKVRGIEHVAKVEPYLLAMNPTEGHNFAMHVGLQVGDAKRLESHGEAGHPRIIAGRDLMPADAGQNVALIGQGQAERAADRVALAGKRAKAHGAKNAPIPARKPSPARAHGASKAADSSPDRAP